MKVRRFIFIALALLAIACSKEDSDDVPPPQSLAGDATGYYCGMNLSEHPGPKGQILLRDNKSAIWFSSVRDTFTFLLLPEEPKDILAVYVTDMAKAPSWEETGPENWIIAAKAVFVVGSNREGGMGGVEAVPFGSKDAAEKFVAEHGGRIVSFEEARTEMEKATAP